MKRDLRDMVVVITGASAGIGEALARSLAARGAKLVLAARRADRLDALNASLGGGHLTVVCDVSKREDCENLIARAIERFGRIDTLVLNAGFGFYRFVSDTSPDDVRRIFATNVFGTTDCIAAAAPHLLKQPLRDGYRAQVMIVSSAAARRSPPYLGPYGATKAAQLSIAEAMRVELKPELIAVTSVHPIMTRTEFGQVAESAGDVKLPRNGTSQTVEHVAAAMVKAIERPRPEVWPHRRSRWSLSLATLLPGVADGVLSRYRSSVQGMNR
ncbi:MAG: SDR family NAD(P)-dependent oxidoreductase [Tepidisphaeraceae bacterium]